MKRLTILFLFLIIGVFYFFGSTLDESHSCSSFMLRKGPVQLFGHYLDSNKEVPGNQTLFTG